jgi:ATP-binding cassette subfamily B protein
MIRLKPKSAACASRDTNENAAPRANISSQPENQTTSNRQADVTPSVSQSDDVLIQLECRLHRAAVFGVRTLEIKSQEFEYSKRRNYVSNRHQDIQSARNEPLIGGGRLEVTTKQGKVIPLVIYSQSVSSKFSEAARGLEQLAKGEELSINLKLEERTRCERCQRLLPEKDGICPACINRNKTLLRVASYLGPYKWQAVALACLSIVTTTINLAPPLIQGKLVNTVLQPRQNLNQLWILMALWLCALAFSSCVQIATGRLNAFLGAHIAADIRASVYRSIEFLRLGYFEKKQVGAITSRVTQDTDRVWGFLTEGLPFLLTNFLLVSGVLIFY